MTYTVKAVKFSLKDIGSQIIDQLSTDVYTGPASIFRELVKNSYDAYLGLDPDDLEDTARQIVISRQRDSSGVGHILLADTGVGQDLQDLKANVQISISRKIEELDNATGFRGLGSWAILGAGSKITITSSKKTVAHDFRLTINVKKIYNRLGPDTTLDDILNDSACIAFEQQAGTADAHYTNIDIECDGPPTSINGHEFNRLYTLTDPNDTALREIIVESCPIPFATDGGVYDKLHEIYRRIKYVPTPVILDGKRLERRLPSALSSFISDDLYIGEQLVAIGWAAEDPNKTGEITKSIDEDNHLLGGPSIRLVVLNVPVGKKGLFADNVRATILDWYVGEVHVVASDVLPSANGQDLRGGTARESFIERLRAFYKRLEQNSEAKSERLSLIRNFRKAKEAATKLSSNSSLSEIDKQLEIAKIAKVVSLFKNPKAKPKTVNEQKVRDALRDPQVSKVKQESYEVIKAAGYIDQFTNTPIPLAGRKKSKSQSSIQSPETDAQLLSIETFQARVGRAVPKLQELGLTEQQVDGVLGIIQDLFTGDVV